MVPRPPNSSPPLNLLTRIELNMLRQTLLEGGVYITDKVADV